MIAVIDYGLGNISNVTRAIKHLGYEVVLTCEEAEMMSADAIVLPGVGHFKDAMVSIHSKGLDQILKKIDGTPIIGICLGMQLLFEHSAEGDVDGLGLVPGNIVPIQTSYPVPHLGWNQLHSQHPLLQTDVYFVHSYQAEMSEHVVAYANYGTQVPGVIQYRHYIGIQFHPEKSGEHGLAILKQALKGGFIDD
ncbi:imidazole glycerol phosphate synthase subunit HisH [Staphylococcus caprae]|mgnify:FL=1|uniref:Imidazole glycerol phosphate synthase subunit HisH n=1 Tax=Staphylococcus caprae TaxID=29380 RepID=A0ABN5W1F3_9STAP|nr:imidazole glycerol phosphate synthase subunit HisH [Staphylococcus caprae]EES41455.1 imidazole glycerol phosphate synthase, glutamine amidotransferase subunit [Staphylococcus caprae M23864:W1]MBN6826533.1 imidazole glycerol phosphate synthase subunit HisH [Staphylococcus caprae]MBX5317180.1 imidazole glycerol phosphate synthase subunit HisH [Staphylococcus caprae]MBX5323270.1 imidazole glycerol phosphate synthase subunit HisH [Staphylococcus caprae]MDI0014762.1 imidazole glycerol phosphate 